MSSLPSLVPCPRLRTVLWTLALSLSTVELVAATASVFPGSLVKVPFTSSLLPASDASSLADSAALAKAVVAANSSGIPASTNNAVLKVVVPVQAGNGQTFNDVLIDTGSAVLWVGGEEAYVPGPFTRSSNGDEDINSFGVGYGIGGVSGPAFFDRVSIGGATVNTQIIGASNATVGFTLVRPIDGILGLGPSGSNSGQVMFANSSQTDLSTPTFVESLVAEGTISEPIFGIYVNPLDSVSGAQIGQGEITFGGVDEDKIDGDIIWVLQNPPINIHWEFNVSSFSWGTQKLTNTTLPSRTDAGVLSIGIPFDAFFSIVNSTPGAVFVPNGTLAGFLGFPSNATSSLPAMSFNVAGTSFDIPPERYLVPKSLYPQLNLTESDVAYSWIASAGPNSCSFGQKWLESFYSVYDMKQSRVGFAHIRV